MPSKFKKWCAHRKDGEAFAFLCNHDIKDFNGFYLRPGHIYGCDDDGLFVAAPYDNNSRKAKRPVRVYRQYHVRYENEIYSQTVKTTNGSMRTLCAMKPGALEYEWRIETVAFDSPTAKEIMRLSGKRNHGVYFGSIESQVKAIYNPRISTGKYMKMEYTRIPGGAWRTPVEHNDGFVKSLESRKSGN